MQVIRLHLHVLSPAVTVDTTAPAPVASANWDGSATYDTDTTLTVNWTASPSGSILLIIDLKYIQMLAAPQLTAQLQLLVTLLLHQTTLYQQMVITTLK